MKKMYPNSGPSQVKEFADREHLAFGRALAKVYTTLDIENKEFTSLAEANACLEVWREAAHHIKEQVQFEESWRKVKGDDIPTREIEVSQSDLAQALVDYSWEGVGTPSTTPTAIAATEIALLLDPVCFDAYGVLGYLKDREGDWAAAEQFYRKGLTVGEVMFTPEVIKRLTREQSWWGDVRTRPYMRLEVNLANVYRITKRFPEAIRHYKKLLRWNRNDNQGIRYELLACALEAGEYRLAASLIKKMKDEVPHAQQEYPRALLTFSQHGDTPESRAALMEAFRTNAHLPGMLVSGGDKLLKVELQAYSHGSVMEAIMCFQSLVGVWRKVPGAIKWMRELALANDLLDWPRPRYFFHDDIYYAEFEEMAREIGSPYERGVGHDKHLEHVKQTECQSLIDDLQGRGIVWGDLFTSLIQVFGLVRDNRGYTFGFVTKLDGNQKVDLYGPRLAVKDPAQWEMLFKTLGFDATRYIRDIRKTSKAE